MSKQIILKSKLKTEALNATGRLYFGQEEYVYIKSFSYDDNNSIKVNFYLLAKIDEESFNLISNVSSPNYTYSIADGKSFTDINGFKVYKKDVNGDVLYQDKEIESTDTEGNTVTTIVTEPVERLDDFTRNFIGFSQLLIPSIFPDIDNYLGYHNNENGVIDNPIIQDGDGDGE